MVKEDNLLGRILQTTGTTSHVRVSYTCEVFLLLKRFYSYFKE